MRKISALVSIFLLFLVGCGNTVSYQEVSLGGFSFSIPSVYTANEEYRDGMIYKTKGESAAISFSYNGESLEKSYYMDTYKKDKSVAVDFCDTTCKAVLSSLVEGEDGLLIGEIYSEEIFPEGCDGRTFHVKASDGTKVQEVYISWMADYDMNAFQIVTLFSCSKNYVDNYIKMIQSAIPVRVDSDETTVSEDDKAVGSIPAYSKDDFVGAYVSEKGTAFSLFSNGMAECYYATWSAPKPGCSWSYEGGRLSINISPLNKVIYSDIKESTIDSLFFLTEGGESELYKKVSASGKRYSMEEYLAFAEDAFNIKLDRPDTTQKVFTGGYVFQLPLSYLRTSDYYGNENIIRFEDDTKGNNAVAMFSKESLDDSDWKKLETPEICDAFLDTACDRIPESLLNGIYVQSTQDIKISHPSSKVMAKTSYLSNYNHLHYACILNVEKQSLALVVIYTDSGLRLNEFKTVLETADYAINANASSSANKNALSSEKNGVTPELKTFLDSYEDFIDEYVRFMQNYNNAGDLSLISEYALMVQKYYAMASAAEKYKTNQMSKEDLNYYLDVMNRCNQKLLAVMDY